MMFAGIEADGVMIDSKHIELFDALSFSSIQQQRVRVLVMIDQADLGIEFKMPVPSKPKKLWELGGFLKDNSLSKKHPLDVQKEMRDEWD